MWNQLRKVIQRIYGVSFTAAAIAVGGIGDDRSSNVDTNDNHTIIPQNTCNNKTGQTKTLQEAISKSRELIQHFKEEIGAPGFAVGVSIDGNLIWEEGIGYSDLENKVPCSPNTVMRIASISKSITMAAVAKIWEEGKLDLDKPVQEYVPSFPEKIHDGEKVVITTRHLLSHLSGIRHYEKVKENKSDSKSKEKSTESSQSDEFDNKEYYIRESYLSVTDSLNLFKDDPLAFKPGTSYLYTTHGWTLVSAVVESVVKTPFEKYITQLLKDFGMNHTHLDVNEKLIKNRSRFYAKNKMGHIENAPYVDNSYKWAGGGILSTVGDLVRFGNLMLYSFQHKVNKSVGDRSKSEGDDKYSQCLSRHGVCCNVNELLPGYLKSETVEKMWTPVQLAKLSNIYYAMGWSVAPEKKEYEFGVYQRHVLGHTGGAIGGSSVLLIMPRKAQQGNVELCPPRGIVVSILTNLQQVSLYKVALEIAQNFDEIPT